MASQNFSQSTTTSVRDRLPPLCFLNLEDSDEETLTGLLGVQSDYFNSLTDSFSGLDVQVQCSDDDDESSDDRSLAAGTVYNVCL